MEGNGSSGLAPATDAFFDLSAQLMAVLCPQSWRVLRANASLHRELGTDELLGRIHPDDESHLREYLAEVSVRRSDLTSCTVRVRFCTGEYRLVTWNAQSAQHDSLLYLAGTAREQDEHFRTIFETAAVGIAVVGLDARWWQINQRLCAILGYSEEELRRLTFVDLTHPDDLDKDRSLLHQLLNRQIERYRLEKRYVRRDGSLVWVDQTVALQLDTEGKPGNFIGIVEDISARKQAEIEREQLMQHLRASQARLEAVMNQMPSGLFIVEAPEGRIVASNAEAERILGHAAIPSERVDAYAAYGGIHSDGRAYAAHEYPTARALLNGEHIRNEFMTYRRGDGSLTYLSTNAAPLYEGDRVAGAVCTFHDITHRVELERALRASEARFRLALHAGSYGVWDMDVNTGRVEADDTVRQLFGLDATRRDISADEVLSAIHPDDRDRVKAAMKRALDDEDRYEAEFRVVMPNGEIHWVAGFGETERDTTGKVARVIGINRGITDRKNAEEALRRRELELQVERDRLAKIFEQAPAFIAVLRGWDLVFDLANSAYFRLVGHREIIGKPVREALPELRGQGFDEGLREVLRTGKALVGTGVPVQLQQSADSELTDCYVDFVYTPMTELDGTRSGVVAIGYEVTERVRAEKVQRALQEQLTRSAREFQQIADSLPQMVWVTGSNGYHEWFNRRWYAYTGSTVEQSVGELWSDFFHPDDLAEARRNWAHSLATGQSYHVEYRCRRYDGAWRWFLGQAEPIRDEAGAILRWFGTCTDIHDQKTIEQALRDSNEDLERFAYVAGHDLQEPLRIVKSFSQLLARRYLGKIDATADEYIRFIASAADRMSRLIQDLLAYSRATGPATLHLKPTDSRLALQTAVDNLASRIEETSAEVNTAPLPVVPAAEGLLVQVFQNLVSNALKYTREGVAPRIFVSAREDAGFHVFSVQDNGQGIAPEHQRLLFNLFSRLHGRDIEGSGIGLATVKRIVERHGGRVWVESEPGAGSTFFFSLPADVVAGA